MITYTLHKKEEEDLWAQKIYKKNAVFMLYVNSYKLIMRTWHVFVNLF